MFGLPHVAKSKSLSSNDIGTISSPYKDVICVILHGLWHVTPCHLLNVEWHLYLSHSSTTHICKNLILWYVIVIQDESWVGHYFGLWDVSQTTSFHHAKKISYLVATSIGGSYVTLEYYKWDDGQNIYDSLMHCPKSYSTHYWWRYSMSFGTSIFLPMLSHLYFPLQCYGSHAVSENASCFGPKDNSSTFPGW